MTVNLHRPVYEICHRLGLDPNEVASLGIEPRRIVATVYLVEDGDLVIRAGDAVTFRREWEIETAAEDGG